MITLDSVWQRMMEKWYYALLFMFLIGMNFGMVLCPLLVSCTTTIPMNLTRQNISALLNITAK